MNKKEINKLTRLDKMNIPNQYKKKLKDAAKLWIKFIKEERGKITDEGNESHYLYHAGEISFAEFFFNLTKDKKIKRIK